VDRFSYAGCSGLVVWWFLGWGFIYSCPQVVWWCDHLVVFVFVGDFVLVFLCHPLSFVLFWGGDFGFVEVGVYFTTLGVTNNIVSFTF